MNWPELGCGFFSSQEMQICMFRSLSISNSSVYKENMWHSGIDTKTISSENIRYKVKKNYLALCYELYVNCMSFIVAVFVEKQCKLLCYH